MLESMNTKINQGDSISILHYRERFLLINVTLLTSNKQCPKNPPSKFHKMRSSIKSTALLKTRILTNCYGKEQSKHPSKNGTDLQKADFSSEKNHLSVIIIIINQELAVWN